jgi:hypothetical protein
MLVRFAPEWQTIGQESIGESARVARRFGGAFSENPSAAWASLYPTLSAELWAISPIDAHYPPPTRRPRRTGGGPESFRGMARQIPNHLSEWFLAATRSRAADPGCSET